MSLLCLVHVEVTQAMSSSKLTLLRLISTLLQKKQNFPMVRMLLLHDLQQTTWLTWKLVEWKVECKLFVLECSLDHSFIALKKHSNKFYCHVKYKLFSEYEISSISLPRKCRGLARHRLHSSRQPNASNSQTNSSMFRNFKSCGKKHKRFCTCQAFRCIVFQANENLFFRGDFLFP